MENRPSLRDLALKYGTDKAGHHEYCEAYEFFLSGMKYHTFTMIELGIGGAENPNKGGSSLRMWMEYFPLAEIHGIDIHKKALDGFDDNRVKIHQGSQDDGTFLNSVLASTRITPKVIIDDASHINALTLRTFELLFPALAPGGVYVVEDIHTSYWPEIYGGGFHDGTVMEFFKAQADFLNQEHWHYQNANRINLVTPFIADIESIHFFKEIIFIRKKL